jgi:hypothetical protein
MEPQKPDLKLSMRRTKLSMIPKNRIMRGNTGRLNERRKKLVRKKNDNPL